MDKGLIVHALILNDQGEVLIIKRQANDEVLPNVWDVPGGTLEDGEDPGVGIMRETREETGLEIKEPRLFNYTSNIDTGKDKQFVRLIFTAHYAGGTVKLNPEEHDAFQWVNPGQPDDLSLVEYLPSCFALLNKR